MLLANRHIYLFPADWVSQKIDWVGECEAARCMKASQSDVLHALEQYIMVRLKSKFSVLRWILSYSSERVIQCTVTSPNQVMCGNSSTDAIEYLLSPVDV